MTPRRKLAIGLALPTLAPCAAALFAGLIWGSLRCDDACGDTALDWRRTTGAWQWDVLPWLGVLVAVAGLLFVVLVGRGRPVAAAAALAIAAITCVAEMEWLSPDWNDHIARHGDAVALVVGALVAAVAAIRLTALEEV